MGLFMMKGSLSGFQEKIGEIIRPLPLHPNHITILSVIFAIAGSYFLWKNDALGLAFFVLAFAIDGLDGALARAKNLTSNFGAYLDGISDRFVEFFAILPLLFQAQLMLPSIFTLFFGTCMVSFSKAYADHREVLDSKTASKLKTLLPRAERVIGIFICLALVQFNYIYEATLLMWALAILSAVSVIYLQFEVYSKLGKGKSG